MTYSEHSIKAAVQVYFEQVRAVARKIKPGMTRGEVEALFRQCHGGVQGTQITIYHQARGAKVEVPFDTFGGPFSVQNRVTGEARVFIEMAGNRWGLEIQK